jgi:hypothetical protein
VKKHHGHSLYEEDGRSRVRGEFVRTPEQVRQRVQVIAGQRKVTALLCAEVGTDPATDKPTLSWRFDQAALDTEQATDGWYGC